MAIETKDVLEYLGIEGVDKFEDFRAKFEPTFIKRSLIREDKELVGQVVGRAIGSATTTLISDLKKIGIDISKDEVKEMPFENILQLGIKKLSDHYSGQINELKSKSPQDSEAIKEIQEKLQKTESKLHDTKSLLDQTKQKYDADMQSWQSQIKGVKLNTKVGDKYKSIKWKTGASEIEKKGFIATLNEKYKIDLDETEEPFIMNQKGERIPHPKKNGEWKSIEEIFEEEGKAAGVWEGNPVAGKAQPRPAVVTGGRQIEQPALSSGRPRILSPAAAAAEGSGK